MENFFINIKFLALICLGLTLIASVASNIYFGYASADNRTSFESAGLKNLTSTKKTNIVLVHGAGSDSGVQPRTTPIEKADRERLSISDKKRAAEKSV